MVVVKVQSPQGQAPTPGSEERRCRILVVDDENGPRQALRILLKEDYEVFLAQDVATARAILQEEHIDLVITDIRMPKESGMSLLEWVKEHDHSIEVILLTGYGHLTTASKAVEWGAFAYIEKPFDNAAMLDYVCRALEKRRRELERRQLEELALEANRFETLGRFVFGMLHDLATPLSVINTYVDLIQADPQKNDLDRKLGVVRSQIRHCADLVRAAMSFLRHRATPMASIHINDVVVSCLEVSGAMLQKESVVVKSGLAQALPLCRGDFVLLRQAILNLINNAVQAMENREEPREVHLRTWVEQGRICLSVRDTGPGIPPAYRSKIFNTFFTTKSARGTGLGLAAVRHIMKRHDGDVSLVEPEGGGAEFILSFPLEGKHS